MIYSANYSLKEPQKNVDLADVNDLNYNTEAIDGLIHNTQISLAPAYDHTLTYEVGDLVMYDTLLYKCIIAITVAEAWDATKWERAVLSDSAGGGGGNANVTELTYNQYLALSQAEKTNGTIYMVTDDPSDSASGGGGGGGLNYSYTEQDTGLTWVDGSHIYQKTVNFGSLPNNGYKDVSAGVVNFDKLINIWGNLTWSSGLQESLDHNNFGDAEVAFQVTSSGDVRCTTQMDRSNITAVVTLQYTKATSIS